MKQTEQRKITKYAIDHPFFFAAGCSIAFTIWMLLIQRLPIVISLVVGFICFLMQMFIWRKNGPGPRHERKYWGKNPGK